MESQEGGHQMKGGRIFRRGRRWWVAVYFKGEEIRRGGGKTREAARTKLKKLKAELTGEDFIVGEDTVTVSDLLDSYETDLERRCRKSIGSVRSHMKPLRRVLGDYTANEVSVITIEWFQRKRIKARRSTGTIDKETEILRAAYRLGQKRKLIKQVPYFPFFRADNRRTGFFETDQVERLLRELPAPIADATEFAYLSGWRKGEILPLRWEAVDRAAREIRLETSKSGDPRTLPLEGALWLLIEKRWRERQYQKGTLTELSPLVFHDGGKPISDFRKSWAAACKRAGVAGRIFHDLRRSAVRNMIRAGVPQSVAMAISGHRTISVFLRYAITSEDDKRKALRDTGTFIRLDRAEREALNVPEELAPSDNSPAAKKRTKRRTKSKGG
jgi:integrase